MQSRTRGGLCIAVASILLLGATALFAQEPPLDTLLLGGLRFAGDQLRASVGDLGDTLRFPRTAGPNGHWSTVQARDWTAGFFPGCLWRVGSFLQDETLLRAAGTWTTALESTQWHAGSHDIGFIMFSSFGNSYKVHPSPETKAILLQSARTLSTRFNPAVGCIRSWDRRKWPFPVIIDNLMNLELLLWASENGGSPEMRQIAISHAEHTMRNHVRADGSTFHVISYDTTTGSVLERVTHQGAADSSTWSRGQAWAINGFTMVYRYTHDPKFLETARRVADYFLAHLPADHVPYWDFQAPGIPNEPRDASAAAIAASGLVELSRMVKGPDAERYRTAAGEILRSLSSPPYLAVDRGTRGVLRHATGHAPAKSEIDVSLIYADYYYIEAALRWLGQP